MLLWMANRNEAFRPFDELFEDKGLAEQTAYKSVAEKLPAYFATRPLYRRKTPSRRACLTCCERRRWQHQAR